MDMAARATLHCYAHKRRASFEEAVILESEYLFGQDDFELVQDDAVPEVSERIRGIEGYHIICVEKHERRRERKDAQISLGKVVLSLSLSSEAFMLSQNRPVI